MDDQKKQRRIFSDAVFTRSYSSIVQYMKYL